MKPLHPQVMVVRLPDSIRSSQTNLFIIVLHDGKEWKVMHSLPLPREKAEERARWLSDVLEHARDAALEEAAKVCLGISESFAPSWSAADSAGHDMSQAYIAHDLATAIRARKGVYDGRG